jgi:hypothetical protein
MKLTKEFVEGFLERYDGDLSEPILDVAGRADPVGSLLEYLNRKDIIEWLQYEFDGRKSLPIERPVKDTVSSGPPIHAPEQLLGIEEPGLRVFSSPLRCFAFCTATRADENRPPM